MLRNWCEHIFKVYRKRAKKVERSLSNLYRCALYSFFEITERELQNLFDFFSPADRDYRINLIVLDIQTFFVTLRCQRHFSQIHFFPLDLSLPCALLFGLSVSLSFSIRLEDQCSRSYDIVLLTSPHVQPIPEMSKSRSRSMAFFRSRIAFFFKTIEQG